MSQTTESPMKRIRLEKVVLNMGVGKSGDVITPSVPVKFPLHLNSLKQQQINSKWSERYGY